ncbi:MAG: hypothetical protein ACK56I_25510, partial [bacterium]
LCRGQLTPITRSNSELTRHEHLTPARPAQLSPRTNRNRPRWPHTEHSPCPVAVVAEPSLLGGGWPLRGCRCRGDVCCCPVWAHGKRRHLSE